MKTTTILGVVLTLTVPAPVLASEAAPSSEEAAAKESSKEQEGQQAKNQTLEKARDQQAEDQQAEDAQAGDPAGNESLSTEVCGVTTSTRIPDARWKVEKAERALTEARQELEQAEAGEAVATRELERAQGGNTDALEKVRSASQAVAAAQKRFEEADAAYVAAKNELTLLIYCYERAVRWKHGLKGTTLFAGAAGGWNANEFGLGYVGRYQRALNVYAEITYVSVQPADAAQRRYDLGALRFGTAFGSGFSAVTLGAGGTFPNSKQGTTLLPSAGVLFRFGNDLSAEAGGTLFTDLRFFLEPWIPLDGEPVRVMFGLQLGFGIGFSRVGQASDVRLAGHEGL